MQIVLLLILSCLSSIAYRAGGLSREQPHWIPVWMRRSWVRDWLCPACFGLLFIPQTGFQLVMWLLYYLFCGISLSTYYDELFGYDNFAFAGFTVGMSAAFLCFVGLSVPLMILRTLMIVIVWHSLSMLEDKNSDHISEHGRGFVLG